MGHGAQALCATRELSCPRWHNVCPCVCQLHAVQVQVPLPDCQCHITQKIVRKGSELMIGYTPQARCTKGFIEISRKCGSDPTHNWRRVEANLSLLTRSSKRSPSIPPKSRHEQVTAQVPNAQDSSSHYSRRQQVYVIRAGHHHTCHRGSQVGGQEGPLLPGSLQHISG